MLDEKYYRKSKIYKSFGINNCGNFAFYSQIMKSVVFGLSWWFWPRLYKSLKIGTKNSVVLKLVFSLTLRFYSSSNKCCAVNSKMHEQRNFWNRSNLKCNILYSSTLPVLLLLYVEIFTDFLFVLETRCSRNVDKTKLNIL